VSTVSSASEITIFYKNKSRNSSKISHAIKIFVSVQAVLAKLSAVLLTMEQQYHPNDNDTHHANTR